jgi:hypothetical protein
MPRKLPKAPDDIPVLMPVKSSNVYAIGYSIRDQQLFVQFRMAGTERPSPGAMYRYDNVPITVWRRFKEARSKGHFLAVHVKGTYWYMKWTGRTWRPETALRHDSKKKKRLKDLARKLRDQTGAS